MPETKEETCEKFIIIPYKFTEYCIAGLYLWMEYNELSYFLIAKEFNFTFRATQTNKKWHRTAVIYLIKLSNIFINLENQR